MGKIKINIKVGNGHATAWIHKGATATRKTIRLK